MDLNSSQLYGKYSVSRAFGWPVINDKHVNSNIHMRICSPKMMAMAPKPVTLNPC
jgi:hypothetical protein